VVVVVGSAVALVWRHLVDLDQPFDPLLAGLWVGMTLLLSWRFGPARDAVLALAGVCGGFLIEWWGTTTSLWTYFTGEQPPLWIIPAWPVAALATDRLTTIADRAIPGCGKLGWRVAYAAALLGFFGFMLAFMMPAVGTLSSRVVIVVMVVVLVTCRDARRDLLLFAMGTALGWLLEYWGTTRACWTYYTRQTPPLVTAFAHGFASVAFARAAGVGLALGERAVAWARARLAAVQPVGPPGHRTRHPTDTHPGGLGSCLSSKEPGPTRT
jgi:hypothetical protein